MCLCIIISFFLFSPVEYNFYCNGMPSVTDEMSKDEAQSDSRKYTVEDLFCCSCAPYFLEAIKLRYPEYTCN